MNDRNKEREKEGKLERQDRTKERRVEKGRKISKEGNRGNILEIRILYNNNLFVYLELNVKSLLAK